MGYTIIEKIIRDHSDDKDIYPGKVVWIDLDYRTARDFGGPNVVKNFIKEYPGEKVADISRTFFTFDTVAPAKTIPYANNQHLCRKFSEEQGVKVYDVDQGIGSHLAIEKGYVIPGTTLVGTDSHLNILGAVCAFGQGMGDQDITFAFKTGKTWFEIPETIKVVFEGKLRNGLSAKDLTLAYVREMGANGALGKAVEFYGEEIDKLSLAGRITLASMITETGGIVGLIPPSSDILEYCKVRSGKKEVPDYKADENASYSDIITIDLDKVDYLISAPPKPDNVVNVGDVRGRKVDSVFLGSCTNGRIEDMREAADILRDRKVKENVMMRVVPATKEVYGEMLKEGIVELFYNAGVILTNPGCGGCAQGQVGMTGEGEVQVSTGNRNFKGKQGSGDTYLCSPAVAAACAVKGKICTPEDL
ncbi:aconitase/3-isopropylmalate dehydratase large subunit family protein [candidate division KSB1 bacterium]